jgi:(p)ppGpp synthase/HD superfamily hydrolase
VLTARFEEALLYATRLHSTQTRKASDIPYISHLMAVASLALEYGGGEDEAIAALLHDAIEDQGGDETRIELLRRFGPDITAIVDGCTDADTFPKPPWQPRKEAYVAGLRAASRSVLLVVACDKLHNARAMVKDYRVCGEALWSRFSGGRAGMLWYYRVLADLLRSSDLVQVAAELNRVVTELESLASCAAR